jgi:hypothetical protein
LPHEIDPVPITQEVGWEIKSVWTGAEIILLDSIVCSNWPYRLSYTDILRVRDIKLDKECTCNLMWSCVCATVVTVEKQELFCIVVVKLLW